MAFNSVNFLVARHINDLSIVDITWSLMFLIPNAMLMYDRRNNINPVMKFTFGILTIWSLRLAYHIGKRHQGEDYRYKMIKKRWENRGPVGQFFSAFLWVFGLQGLLSMVNNASIMYIMKYSAKNQALGKYEIIGGLVWLAGFMCEAIGDR